MNKYLRLYLKLALITGGLFGGAFFIIIGVVLCLLEVYWFGFALAHFFGLMALLFGLCVLGGAFYGATMSLTMVTYQIIKVRSAGYGSIPDSLEVDHWRIHIFKQPSVSAFQVVMNAVGQLPRSRLEWIDPASGTFHVVIEKWNIKTSIIKIDIQQMGEGKCVINSYIRSRNRFQLVDGGENLKTIEKLSEFIQFQIDRLPPMTQWGTPDVEDAWLPWHQYPDTYTFPHIMRSMDRREMTGGRD